MMINTYSDMEAALLKQEIIDDYAKHKAASEAAGQVPLAPIARRNIFLSESLKNAAPEVQERVRIENARRNSKKDNLPRKLASIHDFKKNMPESERQETAMKYQA